MGHSFSSKKQASFNFIAAVTICSDSGAQENKGCHYFHCFPIYLWWSAWIRCHYLTFLNVEFKAAFSLSSFTFIKKLFSSSLLSAIRVVSSAYRRLLTFLQEILIPTCASSSLAFPMMYSAYKLNKQGDNIQSWPTYFPIFNQSLVPCPVPTVASWPAYMFSGGRQAGLVFLSLEEFSKIWCDPHSQWLWHDHTVQIFGVVNKTDVDVFLEFSCFFGDPIDVGNSISGSSAFF